MVDRNHIARTAFQAGLGKRAGGSAHPIVGPDGTVKALPAVVIGIPSFDMLHADFAMCLAAMAYAPGARIALVNHKGSLIPTSRNVIVDQAQRLGVDYVFMVDSDMTFPQSTLRTLLSHQVDIVGGCYVRRTKPHDLHVKLLPGRDREIVQSGIHEVMAVPTGCLLVKMSVFDRLKRPYFRTPAFEEGEALPEWMRDLYRGEDIHEARIIGEDYYFSMAARRAGFKVHMDVDITQKLGHIGSHTFFPETYETAEQAHVAVAANQE